MRVLKSVLKKCKNVETSSLKAELWRPQLVNAVFLAVYQIDIVLLFPKLSWIWFGNDPEGSILRKFSLSHFCFSGDRWDGGPWADGLHPPRSVPPSYVQVRNFLFHFLVFLHSVSPQSLQHLSWMWFRWKLQAYLNSLNHHQDHPSREVLACRSRRSLGGIPGEGGHICRSSMCWWVCACAR